MKTLSHAWYTILATFVKLAAATLMSKITSRTELGCKVLIGTRHVLNMNVVWPRSLFHLGTQQVSPSQWLVIGAPQIPNGHQCRLFQIVNVSLNHKIFHFLSKYRSQHFHHVAGVACIEPPMPPNNTNLERNYVGGSTVPFGTGSNYTCKDGTFFGSDFHKTHIAIECYNNGSWEAPGLEKGYCLIVMIYCRYLFGFRNMGEMLLSVREILLWSSNSTIQWWRV